MAKGRILVVDDEIYIVHILDFSLGMEGYEVLTALDGEQALEKARAERPDLIVLADTVCCGQKASTVAARPGWDRISAVRTGSIVRIHDAIASRWGPRLVNFYRAMAAALARLRQ